MRTSSTLVAGIIEVDTAIDLEPFITAASALVDDVAAASDLDATRLELIERWLSAHFYCMRDPRTTQERAGPVGASYQSSVGPNLSTSHYGQMAMTLDTSGTLKTLSRGKIAATVSWLGTESET